MTKLKDLKTRFMEEAEFRNEYGHADPEYARLEARIRARIAVKPSEGRASPAKRRSSSSR